MQITSGEDALVFLRQCWEDPLFGHDEPLQLKSCGFTIILDPGDGVGDYRMTRAINLAQLHLNRLYLLAKVGEPMGRLSSYEREMLSLGFKIGSGSTKIDLEHLKAMLAVQKLLPAHWSIRTRNIVIAGVIAAYAASPFVGSIEHHFTETRKAQIQVDGKVQVAHIQAQSARDVANIQAKTEIDVALIQAGAKRETYTPAFSFSTAPVSYDTGSIILANLVQSDTSRLVAYAVSDSVAWRPAMASLAPKGGTIGWNGRLPIQAAAAKAYAAYARKLAKDQRRHAIALGRPAVLVAPWVTEILRTHSAPGAMRLGQSEA